jgi:mono/diheme cytochrome c family protein
VRGVAPLLLLLPLAACARQDPAAAEASPPATPVTSAAAAPSLEVSAHAGAAAPAPDGAALFASTCATCHMADGSGVPFLQPSIKGSAWISNPDPQLLLSLILRGSAVLGEAAKAYDNDMAPQEHLTDAEIAAVATYVRARFAATPVKTPVTPTEAALARARPGLPE